MPIRNGHSRLLDADGRPFRFGYDAVEDKKRRRPPKIQLLSEDDQLKRSDRKKLVATGRDLVRNYSVASWALRKHLDYVSDFSFQSRTGDAALDTRIEELVRWWSRPANFDVAGRHGLKRFIRLAEARRTLDGDFFILKLSSGRVQGIEGDRIRTPLGTDAASVKAPEQIVHGVRVSRTGRARGYYLHNRKGISDGFEFDRVVPARHVLAHGYYDRIDQVRGISPLAAGINTLQDTYEAITYAVLKAKVSQIFGVAFLRGEEEEEAMGDVTSATDANGALDKSAGSVDFGRGPFATDLDVEEDVKIIESSQPSTQLQDFMRLLIQIAIKSLDLPFCVFDEAHTNYSGARQAWLLYDQSAESKREENRELLNALLAWRLSLWILDGVLVLPGSMRVRDLSWEWIHRGVPWLDPAKEVKAFGEAIELKLASRQRILKAQGQDFWEIANELAAEEKRLGDSEAAASGAADGTKEKAQFQEAWTVNEKRQADGLEPIAGGDAIYISTGEIPAIDINEEPAQE